MLHERAPLLRYKPVFFYYVYKNTVLYIRINEIGMTARYVWTFSLHFITIIIEYNEVMITQTLELSTKITICEHLIIYG